jgi:hypothetical protein
MRPTRRALVRVLLILPLILPAACATNRPSPGSSPTTAPSPGPSPTVTTPAPVPSTAPGTVAPTPPAGWTVVSSRVTYPWRWPAGDPVTVAHRVAVPPVPALVTIGAGNHPNDPGDRPYNRMSFSFTTALPSYTFQYVPELVADASGQVIPLEGYGVLRIVFRPAQGHAVVSKPPAHLGMSRMIVYRQAGDYEAVLTYGIGITYPVAHSNPQIPVRVVEVTYVNPQGAHRYVVAFDVDAR